MLGDKENGRLEEVRSLLTLDFDKKEELHDILDLASQLCDKPVALITLLDESKNWIKLGVGANQEAMPRKTSFCHHAIQQDELMIVNDAIHDERFKSNELVTQDPKVRFYAGAPLKLANGQNVGTLCLFDTKPNQLDEMQQKVLSVLAKQVVYVMELELGKKSLEKKMQEIQAKNDSLKKIAFIQSHTIRQPLTSIMGLVNLVRDNYQELNNEWIQMLCQATDSLDQRIREIVAETLAEKDIKVLRFNKMIEEIEDYAILLLDRAGNIENWNKGAHILKGYHANEIIGNNFSVFYTPEDIENDLPGRLIRQAEENGSCKSLGWRVRKDGSRFWGSILITAIHNQEGDVIGFTKVTRLLEQQQPEPV